MYRAPTHCKLSTLLMLNSTLVGWGGEQACFLQGINPCLNLEMLQHM